MKKMIYLVVLLAGFSAAAAIPPDVNEKVLKAFEETFSGAVNVNWTEKNDSYEVSFHQQQVQVRAMFDEDGNLLQTIRYYGEKDLPANILSKLNKRYSGKEIFGVTELRSDTEVSYYITLRDEKNWYVVKSDPYGSLELTRKFRDGSPKS